MRRFAALVGAVTLALVATAAPVTLARLTSGPTSTGSFGTGSIAPPTGLGASVGGTTVTLTWTPSTSSIVTGYDVLRSTTSGSGYSVVSSVTPRTATTTTNAPGTGTFSYVLQSVFQSWRSAPSNEASASLGTTSTGLKNCASNAFDTGGNNNGYESNAGNACADDGSNAVDANTGTNTTTTCSNTGKDRHRFWGYAFGLPASVSSINGITVQADAGLSNNGGNSYLCVELSWDGGSSWTASKQVTMSSSAMTLYTFGGTTDTWGRTWTVGNFSTSNFRVRVIDVSSQGNKDYGLDSIQVSVTYTP